MNTTDNKVCESCGNKYFRSRRAAQSVWDRSRFCSYECFKKWNVGRNNGRWKERPILLCKLCGTEISCKDRNYQQYLQRMFCDGCKYKSRSGAGNPKWKGGKHFSKRGYVIVGSRDTEHRLVAEKALGRKLRGKQEMVHHIDMNKHNSRNDNLLICTPEYHRYIHHRMELEWVKDHITNMVDPSFLISGCIPHSI